MSWFKSMRGSHPQDGELNPVPRAAFFGKIAVGDQSMRGSHPQDGELVSPPREGILGKVAPATNSCEAAQVRAPYLTHVC